MIEKILWMIIGAFVFGLGEGVAIWTVRKISAWLYWPYWRFKFWWQKFWKGIEFGAIDKRTAYIRTFGGGYMPISHELLSDYIWL